MADTAMNMQYTTLWVQWWEENQVVFTFHSPEPLESGSKRIIASLHLDQLNGFLQKHNYQLKPYTGQDIPDPRTGDGDDDDDEKSDEDLFRTASPAATMSQPMDSGSENDGSGLNTPTG